MKSGKWRVRRGLGLAVVAAALGLVFAVVPAHLSPQQAHAATISPSAPPPVSVLPSTVAGAGWSMEAQAAFLYRAARYPEFWQSLSAKNAGTATAGQLEVVQQGTDDFRVPSTKPSALVKAVGGASAAFSGYQLGSSVGRGVVELFGIDSQKTVCSNVGDDPLGQFVAFASGNSCEGFAPAPEFVPNEGVQGGQVQSGICSSPTNPQPAAGSAYPAPSCGGTYWWWSADGSTWQNIGHAELASVVPGDASGKWVVTITSTVGSWPTGGSKAYPQIFWSCLNGAGQRLSSGGGNTTGAFGFATQTINVTCASTAPGVGVIMGNRYSAESSSTYWGSVYKSGSAPVPVVTSSDNPTRTLKCVVLGTNGQTYVGESATFTETDARFALPQCADLPEGVYPETMTIEEHGGGETHELYRQDETPEFEAMRTQYPECLAGTCMLDLRKIGPTSTASCFQTPDDCAEWMQDPNRASNYSCHYGTYAVALNECDVYAPTFTEEAQSTGQLYASPTTGEALTSQKAIGKDAEEFNSDVRTPNGSRQCLPEGWGVLNPIEWVMKPVGCAMERAFVPRPSKVEEASDAWETAWAQTAPAKVAAAVGSWEFVPPAGGGCDGFTVDVFFLGPPFQVLNACPGEMFADMAFWSRVFGNVTFTIYGVVAITRHLGRIVGFGGLGTDGDQT